MSDVATNRTRDRPSPAGLAAWLKVARLRLAGARAPEASPAWSLAVGGDRGRDGAAAGHDRSPVAGAVRCGRMAASCAHGAARSPGGHAAPARGRQRAVPGVRHGPRVARHHVSFPGTCSAGPAAGAAARHADLHRRLLLRGAAGLLRPRAGCAARAVRLAYRAGLLVSRGAQLSGRRAGAVRRAVPLRLPHRPRQLRAAVDLRAGGGAYAWADVRRRLQARGPAAGASGARSRPGAGADGVHERSGRGAVSGRADADGEHLHHLAAALEPGRRGADCTRGAAIRVGAAAGGAGSTRPGPVPSHHRPLPFHPVLRPGRLARLRRGRPVRAACRGWIRPAVHPAAGAVGGACGRRACGRLLARRRQ